VIARLRTRLFRRELLPPLLLAACVFIVHDIGYVLTHNYWVDESWVAVSTKYPLRRLPDVTSTTPIGWSALARLFVFAGQQGPRLPPLAFAAAAVAVAYTFARDLGWRADRVRLGAGLLAAIGVLMVPAMLARNDLKQYTADACLALTVLALTSHLERVWSRRGLAVLAVTVGGGMLFSHTVAFVGSVAFAPIVTVQLVRRREIVVSSGRKLKDVRAALQRALATAKRTNAAHLGRQDPRLGRRATSLGHRIPEAADRGSGAGAAGPARNHGPLTRSPARSGSADRK